MLTHPNTFYLSSALGWAGLGLYKQANEEIKKIVPKQRQHPDVLNLRLHLFFRAKKWKNAEVMGRRLVELVPNVEWYWIQLADIVQRKPNGNLDEAKTILEKAAQIFPTGRMVLFNLACYNARLGKLAEAKGWLFRLVDCNEKETVQLILNEPDLEPFHRYFRC